MSITHCFTVTEFILTLSGFTIYLPTIVVKKYKNRGLLPLQVLQSFMSRKLRWRPKKAEAKVNLKLRSRINFSCFLRDMEATF